MELTISTLVSKFNKYNNLYFKGELNMPTFGIKHTKRALGTFCPSDFRIEISDYYIRSEKDYDNTLIHEMIHLYQHQFKTEDRGHGWVFKRECARINRYGWNLSRCDNKFYEVNPIYKKEEKKRKVNNKYNVCYYYEKGNNKYFIFVICDSNLERYKKYFRERKELDAKFFTSTNIIFDNFCRCRSRVRGLYVTRQELALYLKD